MSKKGPALSGTEQVTDFLTRTGHPLRESMVLLREIILGATPGITEQIKWNGPSFCIDGDDRITFNLIKANQIILVFHKGAKGKEKKGNTPFFKDETGLLDWLSNDRAVLKLASLQEVKDKSVELKRVVKEWIDHTRVIASD